MNSKFFSLVTVASHASGTMFSLRWHSWMKYWIELAKYHHRVLKMHPKRPTQAMMNRAKVGAAEKLCQKKLFGQRKVTGWTKLEIFLSLGQQMQQISRVFLLPDLPEKCFGSDSRPLRVFDAFSGMSPFSARSDVAPWNTWVASVGFSRQAPHWRWAGSAKTQVPEWPFSCLGSWTSIHRGLNRRWGGGDRHKLDFADKSEVSCASFATWRYLRTCWEAVEIVRPQCCQHQRGSWLKPG